MKRPIRTIRRSIRAAVQAGRQLVTAVRGAKFGVLVALFAAIDRGATVRIGYRDENGAETVRTITPRFLSISSKGHILVTGHDHLRDEKRTFRTDRITLATKEAPVAVTPAHPLLARLPEAHGRIVRTVPVGPGVVIVTATSDGEFEVTGWRPLDEWEIAADRQAFPGDDWLPTAAYITAQLVAETAGVDAAVTGAVAALTTALALGGA